MWTCAACAFDNSDAVRVCAMCTTARTVSPKPTEAAAAATVDLTGATSAPTSSATLGGAAIAAAAASETETETKVHVAATPPVAPSDTCILCSSSGGYVTCDMSMCRRCGCDVTSGCYKYCRGCALAENKCSTCGTDYKTPRQCLELFVAHETAKVEASLRLYAVGGILGACRERGERAIHRLQREHNRACEGARIFFDNDDGAAQTPFMVARLRQHLALPDPEPMG